MTRAGTIPLSDIAKIQIYTKTAKNTKSGMKSILKETGGDFVVNGAIFLKTLKPCCHLKVDGTVKCQPNYQAWCISWDDPLNFAVRAIPKTGATYKNYMECVHAIIAGKKISPMNYGKDMAYATNRTAIGTKDGQFAYCCTEDNLTPEQLRDRLYDLGWDNAIMMDGGGSTCFLDKDGNGFAGDGRKIPIWIVVTLKKTEYEPEGGKPKMTDGIIAYSLKEDKNKYLTKNFKVSEFRCKDGSDPVFIAEKLPMVLQYIRMRVGKAVTVNSAYRTPTHNESEGGVANSQHCYGTAADIVVNGYTPKQVAAIAREIMPDWGGVGIYSGFTHVDVRAEKADWNG